MLCEEEGVVRLVMGIDQRSSAGERKEAPMESGGRGGAGAIMQPMVVTAKAMVQMACSAAGERERRRWQ